MNQTKMRAMMSRVQSDINVMTVSTSEPSLLDSFSNILIFEVMYA